MTSKQLRNRKIWIGIAIAVLLAISLCLNDFDTTVLLGSAALGLVIGCTLSLISYVDDDSALAQYDLPAARNFCIAILAGYILGSCVNTSVWPWHMRYDDTLIPQIVSGFIITFVYIAWPRRVEQAEEEPEEGQE